MASKRTASAAGLDEFDGPSWSNKPSREMQGSGSDGKKHSMDSDDEDEYQKVAEDDILKDDDIEGQEEPTTATNNSIASSNAKAGNGNDEGDDEVKITPFNLREEMEEGHFSKDGNFVWKNDKEIKDSWLDNIDWVKVKQVSAEENFRRDEKDEEEDAAEAAYDEVRAYRGCLKLMKPGESVAGAIRRLGGGGIGSGGGHLPRWRQKQLQKKLDRQGKKTGEAGTEDGTEDAEQREDNRKLMKVLSGLADSILSRSGNMEIYQETYEKIAFMLKQEDNKKATVLPDGLEDDDALDMFADNLDKDKGSEEQPKVVEASLSMDDEVRWEFKWTKDDKEEVHGPHTSQEMLDWQNSGFFDKGVLVRKLGSQGDFLDGKRVDFDLYI